MKIEFSSQRREMLLFLTTNMAAVTSRANQQLCNLRMEKPIKLNFCDVTILFPKSSMYMYSEQQVVPADYLPSVRPLLAFPNG